MADPWKDFHDGLAPFNYPRAKKQLHTYYHAFSPHSPTTNKVITSLIIIHGGPGLSHDYLLAHSYLSTHHQIPIILYDQIGSGRSTHLPETASVLNFWTEDIFLEQLTQLITHLGIKEYDILGHSWGGMLASKFAGKRPRGLRRLVLVNAAASKRASLENRWKYRREMSEGEQEVLDRCERQGTTGSREYRDAFEAFVERHVCCVDAGEGWGVSEKWAEGDDTVARAMGDNSFWESSGYMKDWDTAEDAKNIDVPTIVINGIKEFASGDAVKPFLDHIPDVRLVTLEGTTHSPHVEAKERYMKVVADFLKSE
ncbi:hypothetical protein HYFRA_00003717 [Hymenoscyphus fraxineus]|uniref:AB hydrolase-1 domain-containing protein n=1 Tax=Hymenoscyphus fraxineus TaxID=746836 RepID=A0A9N9L3H9_9HELO|nr:hypothetical protein HYFRA_00003717 [Hymenoscyphus fraxineus]